MQPSQSHVIGGGSATTNSLLTYLDDSEFEDPVASAPASAVTASSVAIPLNPSSTSSSSLAQAIPSSLPPHLLRNASETTYALRAASGDEGKPLFSISYEGNLAATDEPTARWLEERTPPYASSPPSSGLKLGVGTWKDAGTPPDAESTYDTASSRESNTDSGEFQEAELAGAVRSEKEQEQEKEKEKGESEKAKEKEQEQEIFTFEHEDKDSGGAGADVTTESVNMEDEGPASALTTVVEALRGTESAQSVQESFILVRRDDEAEDSSKGFGHGNVKNVQEEDETRTDKKNVNRIGGDVNIHPHDETEEEKLDEEGETGTSGGPRPTESPVRERGYVVRFTVFKRDEELPLFDEPVKIHFAMMSGGGSKDTTDTNTGRVNASFGTSREPVEVQDVADLRSVLSDALTSHGLHCVPDQLQIFLRSGSMVSRASFFCKDNALYVRETRAIVREGEDDGTEKTEEVVFVMPAQVKVVVDLPAQELPPMHPETQVRAEEPVVSSSEPETEEVSTTTVEEEPVNRKEEGQSSVLSEGKLDASTAAEEAPLEQVDRPDVPSQTEEAPQPEQHLPSVQGVDEAKEAPDAEEVRDTQPAPLQSAPPSRPTIQSETASTSHTTTTDETSSQKKIDTETPSEETTTTESPEVLATTSQSEQKIEHVPQKPAAALTPRANPFSMEGLVEACVCAGSGFRDAFRLRYTKVSLQRSHTVFVGTYNTVLLNLVLLLSVYLIHSYVWLPMLSWALYWKEGPSSTLGLFASAFEVIIRLAFWVRILMLVS
jgi:hypothetical protein